MKDLVAKLRIEAEARGSNNIAALVGEVERLASEGGAAAPEFAKLANELRELQAQQGLVEQFAALKREIADTEAELNTVASAVDTLAGNLDTARTATAQAAEAQAAAAASLGEARAQHEALREAAKGAEIELQALRAAAKTSGDAAGEHATRIAEVKGQLAVLRGEAKGAAGTVAEMAGAHKASVAATREAERAERKLAAEYDRTVSNAGRLSGALGRNRAALDNVRAGMAAAGISTSDLAEQNARLAAAADGVAQRVRNMQGAASTGGRAVGELGGQAREAERDLRGLGDSSDALQTKLKGVAAAIGGVFAVGKLKGYVGDAIAVADAYGQMATRIEQATGSADEYDLVQRRLLETASATYRPLAEAQELYIRTADALRSMRYSTEQALDITDSFSYLLVTNAASAEKAANAINAYSKSIQSGKVDVDSWQSILAAMPTVVDAIATATGKSAEEVRALGVTGKLAVRDLNEGLRQTVEANKAVADSMPTTVADALVSLSNAWSAYIGEANRANGTTQRVVELIGAVRDNLDGLVSAAMKAGNVLMTVFAARALMAVKNYAGALIGAAQASNAAAAAAAAHGRASAAATAGVNAHTAATARQGQAATVAAARVGGLARGLLGLLRFTGWGIAATAVLSFASRLLFAKSAAEELEDQLKDTVAAADFSARDGIDEFAEKLRALGNDVSADQIGEAISKRLKKLGEEDLVALRDNLQAAFEDGGGIDAGLAAALAQVDARLADIAKRENWARPIVTEAEGARFKLSELELAFGKLRAEGASTAEALAEIGKAIDLGSTDGIAELLTGMKKLRDGAQVTGEQIEAELLGRLSKMSAQDLKDFGVQAEMAFNRGEVSAREFGQALDAQARVAMQRLGIDADRTLDGMSAKFTESAASLGVLIGQLGRLRERGVDTGVLLTSAFTGALSTATTSREIEHLTRLIDGAARSGQLAGTQLEGMLDAVRNRAKEVNAEVAKIVGEIGELQRRAANIRAGLAGAGAQAQARRDRGLTDEERDDVNAKRARNALDEASRYATFAQNAALDGRAEKAQEYARQAAELIERAAAAANAIGDDDTAARLLDQVAEAQARELEAQAAMKQKQAAEIAQRSQEQAEALAELEARLAKLAEGTTVAVKPDTAAAEQALAAVQAAVDAIPTEKTVTVRTIYVSDTRNGDGGGSYSAGDLAGELQREALRAGRRQ